MLTKKLLILGIFAKNHIIFLSVRASEGQDDPISIPSALRTSSWITLISAKLTLRCRVSEKTGLRDKEVKNQKRISPPDCYQSHLSANNSCEHACSVPCVPCGCWSSFIGTFRSLDFERSASQNRTTSTLVTTKVEKERFFWWYYNREARNHFKLSVSPPTHPQGLPVVSNHIFVITCALQKQGSMSDKRTFQTI